MTFELSLAFGKSFLFVFAALLPIVRVGGGLILAATAWRLLTATQTTADSRTELAEAFTPEMARRQAFCPLTFPMRLSAFILLCLGVQIVWDGVSELVKGLMASV